jgi:hypothetical protein
MLRKITARSLALWKEFLTTLKERPQRTPRYWNWKYQYKLVKLKNIQIYMVLTDL